MALDIGSYKNVKLLEDQPKFDCDGEVLPEYSSIKHTIARVNNDFFDRAEGIEDRKAYDYEDYVSFRAGSYTGYSTWREWLAKLAGYPLTEYEDYIFGGGTTTKKCHAAAVWDGETKGPFSELINFSDCEGIIGPVVSKKLLKDFQDFDEKARNSVEDPNGNLNDYYYVVYSNFKDAFERASENGWVDFH
jgi:hypothetical protein